MTTFSRLHLAALAIVAAAGLACALYWLQLTESHARLRADTVAQLDRQSIQLAETVAGQAAILVRSIDFALLHVRDEWAKRQPIDGDVQHALESHPAGALLQVAIIDAEGYLAYSSLGMSGRVYLGDREHFKTHPERGQDLLFVSKPVFGRVSKTWSIQLSRGIWQQGRFLGVVVFSVAPEYLAQILAIPGMHDDDVVALFRTDGAYLSRSQDVAGAMGKSVPPERPFIGEAAPARGTFRVAAAFDRIQRTYAWRRVDGMPMVVNVGLAEAAVLGPVDYSIRHGRLRNGIGIAVVLLLAASIASLLVRASARQRALQESENRYRGFFETNTAVKLLIDPADGRIVDANAAAVEYYGYPRATLLAMRIADINCLSPAEVKAEMARAKAEERLYFNFPHRLASGEVRQVEVYSGPLELGGRQLLFSIVHDITTRRELEHKLAESEELHRTLFETMAEGVLVVGGDGRIRAWNDAALAILGVDADGLVNRRSRILDANGHSLAIEDFPSMRAARGEQLEHALFGVVGADGSLGWVTVSSRSMCREGEVHPCAAVVSFSDITRVMEAEESLKLAQSVFEAAGEGIIVTDADNRIVTVNPAFTEITGYRPEEVIGRNPGLLASGQHDAAFYQAMWQRLVVDGRWEGEVVNRRKDGGIYVEWLKISRVADGQGRPRRYVALFSDITEKKRKEEVVWRQANFDALTGLPNRKLLEDRLERAIAQAHRRHSQVALLFIDLDRFKPVNDEFGHAVGDELLHQVGKRLQNSLRDEDTVARLGGDEFVAVLPELRMADAPAKAAEKIVDVLSEPFRVGERILEISCCVGIALFPRDADSPVALIERADAAMYAAKEAGRATWRQA